MTAFDKGISAHQIGWMRTFRARSETYKAAQACVMDAHARHPHSRLRGDGTTVSSDGQFFLAGDRAAKHVSSLSWDHINLTGIYSWDAERQMPEGFRPLRLPGGLLRAA